MKRAGWLGVICLAAGLVTAAAAIGLQAHARAVTGVPPVPPQTDRLGAATGEVVINEVAWMGTEANSSDEWIELHNTRASTVPLEGWHLVDDDGLSITLDGEILPRGYYLVERTDDDAVSDIPADWFGSFGSGGLTNDGEVLTLTDVLGNVVDTANADAGQWPAGTASDGLPPYASMERIDPTAPGSDENWCTNDGVTRDGLDAVGSPINGTPKARNSCYQPPVADLGVAKSGPASVRQGELITYQVVVSNTGTAAATRAFLTDTFPAALGFVTQTSPFSFTPLGRELVWQLGDVAAGMVHTIGAVGRVSDTGTNMVVNVVTVTTATSETTTADNSIACTTTIEALHGAYLPLVLRSYTSPRYGVVIEAALYDGVQYLDYDEAVLLLNGGDEDVDLDGWQLCKWRVSDWGCAELPAVTIVPHQRLWVARQGTDFAQSFGFAPDHELSSWPRFTNSGDEVVLRDPEGASRDVLVYEDGLTAVDGWSGAAIQPYRGTNFAVEGQVLYRFLDEESGFPADDTDTVIDWAQNVGDPQRGRRVRYPGWDLEQFQQPALDAGGIVTAGIAPDNAYGLVVDTIRSARDRIEIEAYTLEHYGLVSELVERAQQGVSVTVMLEGGPVGGVADQELWACQQLHATGHGLCAFMVQADDPRIYPRYKYLHAKFIIVDRERLLLGSQNLTHSNLAADDKTNGSGGSRGVVLATDAPQIVGRAADVFEADCDLRNHADVRVWDPSSVLGYGPPPQGFTPDHGEDWVTYTVQFPNTLAATAAEFELVTAPEGALRSSDGLLGLVSRAGAGDAVFVEQLYEHVDWGDPVSAPNLRLQAYLAAAWRGARVRLLLNGGTFDVEHVSLTDNTETADYVNEIARAEGLDLAARLGDPTNYGIHNKMVLVDLGAEGKFAHAGSINGSETANKVNREMALQVRSAALFNYLYAMFQYDWQH
ncbi:MAG: lamin tail domain-containing protein [Anaerolineae bacterium]|jgi:uncharacterized repeat protein (TIGR01451 family)